MGMTSIVSPHAAGVAEPVAVSGYLTDKDLKRLTDVTRDATVGPTAVYYAGVTAPIISASISLVARTAFTTAGFSNYWVFFLSALVAVFAGISWYLIFMRWSYRHRNGRGGEGSELTTVQVNDDCLSVRRDLVETRIGWPAVTEVRVKRGDLIVLSDGADSLLIPRHWFGKNKTAMKDLHDAILARADIEA